ncbi:leukotriene B4 receptor 2b isoform X2 [Phyllopteryx taeniolatus]|uniref:leukotriene B4 receptor 2b isoform X2 n=1 Tax=Phyllopteryx taeniolatus TaxID=161469 RepID=UPI002AD3C206|nr:leukotriene B4 receptor 2b isoform X2 [Phyllopteryx taeniolatus]
MNNLSEAFSRSTAEDNNPEDGSVVSNDFSTTVGALILGLVFLLGVPGNLFIVWSILARARRRSVTTLLILNLACADGFLMALTIFFVVYLAKQTTSARISRKVVRRVILGMWLLVAVSALPSLVFRDVREDKDERNKTRHVCAPNHTLPRYVRFQYSFETVVGFILPYAVIITSYVLILRRLRQTKFRRKVRSEKLILAIVVMFCLFWLPYHIINMIQVAAEWYSEGSPRRETLEYIYQSSRAVTSALAFISSCANPVLYTFAGKSYIKKNGLGFMARLFEGTSLDQTATKRYKDVKLSNVDSGTASS